MIPFLQRIMTRKGIFIIMKGLSRLALVLVLIGAINWGLIGLFQFDLVAAIFGGQDSLLSRIVYTLVGISSLFCLPLLFDRDDVGDTATADQRRFEQDFATEFAEEPDEDRLYNPSLEAYEVDEEEEQQ